MNAAVVEQYGTPVYGTFREPAADAGQLVVAVAAAGLNPVDVAKAAGTFYAGRTPLPFVAGNEGVGAADGGRRVYFESAIAPFGAMAERALVDADTLIDVPDGLGDAPAVAIGIAGLAAWLPLTWRARLQPGERVLVLGATGTVGTIAVQAAKLLGASVVVAAGRNATALERAKALGADATVQLGDGLAGGELTDAYRTAAGGGFDVVIDPLWGEPALAALAALRVGGRLIQLGQSAGPTAELASAVVRGNLLDIRGHGNFMVPPEIKAEAYLALAGYVAAGDVVIDIEQIPLRDVASAWERQRVGGHGSKLVLIP